MTKKRRKRRTEMKRKRETRRRRESEKEKEIKNEQESEKRREKERRERSKRRETGKGKRSGRETEETTRRNFEKDSWSVLLFSINALGTQKHKNYMFGPVALSDIMVKCVVAGRMKDC